MIIRTGNKVRTFHSTYHPEWGPSNEHRVQVILFAKTHSVAAASDKYKWSTTTIYNWMKRVWEIDSIQDDQSFINVIS